MSLDTAIMAHPDLASTRTELRLALHLAGIPDALRNGLVYYLLDGIRPGGFLSAIIANDLSDAVLRCASVENLLAVPAIVRLLLNSAPAPCHGSRAAIETWLDAQFRRRHQEQIGRVERRLRLSAGV